MQSIFIEATRTQTKQRKNFHLFGDAKFSNGVPKSSLLPNTSCRVRVRSANHYLSSSHLFAFISIKRPPLRQQANLH